MKFLITGHKSGLGRYLYEHFGGIGFDRNMPQALFEHIRREGVDVIIHCASQPPRAVTWRSLYPFIDDNVLLTERIAKVSHKKFIFISSVDVYPKATGSHKEGEDIPLESIKNFYALTKLISESIVSNKSTNYLILRCTALLGKNSRKNSLIKIIEGTRELTLSGRSTFNYILHSDIADFIEYAINKDIRGIYNVASSKNTTLLEVANSLGKKVRFGSYIYNVGGIDNSKISSIFPAFKKTSKEVILQFSKE